MNISKTHHTFFNEYKHKKNLQNNGDNTNINNTGKNSHKKKKSPKYLLKKVRDVQPSNVARRMLVTRFGIVIRFRDEHPAKAPWGMDEIVPGRMISSTSVSRTNTEQENAITDVLYGFP